MVCCSIDALEKSVGRRFLTIERLIIFIDLISFVFYKWKKSKIEGSFPGTANVLKIVYICAQIRRIIKKNWAKTYHISTEWIKRSTKKIQNNGEAVALLCCNFLVPTLYHRCAHIQQWVFTLNHGHCMSEGWVFSIDSGGMFEREGGGRRARPIQIDLLACCNEFNSIKINYFSRTQCLNICECRRCIKWTTTMSASCKFQTVQKPHIAWSPVWLNQMKVHPFGKLSK